MQDVYFMRRALDLAYLGAGTVSPNPMVGCVIVRDQKIIGEGWHKKHGEAHAEVNAIASVSDKSLLQDANIYVNLEPCSHHGKTPPCADLLIEHRVGKVIIANVDTNPLVAGKGIEKLLAAGIEVVTGVLDVEGRDLNKRFFTFFDKKRPYIILKWAQTSDGFIARENFESKWISNDLSRQLVHRWRAEEDAVLVGTNTAQYDNPSLTVREWTGRNPTRIVIDRSLRLDKELSLFDHSQMTLCYNTIKQESNENLLLIKLDEQNFWKGMLDDLYHRKIQSVIIEGGAQTLNALIKNNVWDEARVFTSPQMFERGIVAPDIQSQKKIEEKIKDDHLIIYTNDHPH